MDSIHISLIREKMCILPKTYFVKEDYIDFLLLILPAQGTLHIVLVYHFL